MIQLLCFQDAQFFVCFVVAVFVVAVVVVAVVAAVVVAVVVIVLFVCLFGFYCLFTFSF